MIRLLQKFEQKLLRHGLCEDGTILLGLLDDKFYWNKIDTNTSLLEKVFEELNIASILFAKPAEPYFTILNSLADEATNGFFVPQDSETRTFFHDIPVAETLDLKNIVGALKRRRSIFIKNNGIVTYGTISPEQAFVVYSSVCFSSYVKFFSDILSNPTNWQKKEFAINEATRYLNFLTTCTRNVKLQKGPLHARSDILSAIVDAGKATVQCRLVDSYFGNISYFDGTSIYISQTASSLDELTGCIDECPIDGSSCTGITASSEFTAHREIFLHTQRRAVLHGHPKFSVIMSMQCPLRPCELEGDCHRRCPHKRFIENVPIVPGEIGTGKYGLCQTLPPVLKNSHGAIVYGHGVFTTGENDFADAFKQLADIEIMCVQRYIETIKANDSQKS
ncbi:MAG: class II aldolase/adducin family protein [Spirochaetes bacterium]|nr:class II aldolase/adducin family protein [Spirochaetota bacterium]